jgi:HK97 gp10 family phage protein
MSVSMNWSGLEELTARLTRLNANVDNIAEEALTEAAPLIKNEMESLVPVSNINHRHIKDDIKVTEIKGTGVNKYIDIGVNGSTAWRAKFVEYGTSRSPAQPFMEPALQNKKRDAIAVMATVLRRYLHV